MINIYTGTPGSGKSLHIAQMIRSQIKYRKSLCIANFSFNASALKPKGNATFLYIKNDEMTPELLVRLSEKYKERKKVDHLKEEEILLVIDEAQLVFNARDWNNEYRKSWISFFTQHRKLGYHIIIVAQMIEMVDKQIRGLIEYECIHRKVGNIGKSGKVISAILGGNMHLCVRVYCPLKQKVGTDWFRARKGLYGLYDSYTRF